jgi:DNA repair protein RecN (Recombination protein N)
MLAELHIENFAIIDRLDLRFEPGLITFTGETGAGKSIIIDAVETLLGGRADATMIRTGATHARLEANFHIVPIIRQDLHRILLREDLLEDPDYFSIGREIRSEGRSIARLNGRSVSVGLLREVGELIIDVHGQSEHLSLLRVREHLNLLDRFAGSEPHLAGYRTPYRQLMAVRKELKELRLAESEAARRTDLLSYQINEIESARLTPGEEEELQSEKTRLANSENLATLAQAALVGLDEGTPESPSVVDLLGRVSDALNNLARIDPSQSPLAESVLGTFSTLTDLSHELRSYIDGIEFNPSRLDQVEERLNLIHILKRKYGETIPEILTFAEKSRQQKENIARAGERIAALEEEEGNLLKHIGTQGQALSDFRRKAAGNLEKQIENELVDLRMSGAQFRTDFQRIIDPNGAPIAGGECVSFDATGIDRVEFLIAPNPGEGLKPLVKIASGGETSRLMLALKNVLARADNIPTLIFDEIDQGIGGRVGTVVGHKLWLLARHHQVMCITHLPQLAAFGEQHLQVRKQIHDGRTLTEVADLRGDDRLRELALMLGETSEITKKSAQEMLKTASGMIEQESP